jgi:hypothetical protein
MKNIIIVKSVEDELIAINFNAIESVRLYSDDKKHYVGISYPSYDKCYTVTYETWHEIARMLRLQWSKLL